MILYRPKTLEVLIYSQVYSIYDASIYDASKDKYIMNIEATDLDVCIRRCFPCRRICCL